MTEPTEGITERSLCPAAAPGVPTCERLVAEARSQQIQELTSALAARDHIIAYICHELRNSLAPVQLLTDHFAVLTDDLQRVPVAAARAAALVHKLRGFVTTIRRVAEIADLRQGELHLEPTTVDLVDIALEVCRELAGEAAAGGAELVLDADAPVVGSWDRVRLKQIVVNLVSNAIRRAGGGRIELGLIARDDQAELVIRDHGPGIDPVVLPRLFDDLDQPRGQRSGPFGVGLWVVKILITAMGGTVAAANHPEGGARFCVVVPRGEIAHA